MDEILEKKPNSFKDFLKALEAMDYTIKRGKHITVFAPRQKHSTRLNTFKGDYTQAAIKERISGLRKNPPTRERYGKAVGTPKLNRLIDIPGFTTSKNYRKPSPIYKTMG